MKTNSGFLADSQLTVLSLKQVYFKKNSSRIRNRSLHTLGVKYAIEMSRIDSTKNGKNLSDSRKNNQLLIQKYDHTIIEKPLLPVHNRVRLSAMGEESRS